MRGRRTPAFPAAIPLLGALGLAAVAGGPGYGCARAGSTGDQPGDVGGGSSGGGSSSGSGGASSSGSSSGPVAPPSAGIGIFSAPCTKGTTTVDWSPVRRISRIEYDNMVRDLLGDKTQPATAFVAETAMAHGVNFQTNTYTGVSLRIAQDYQSAAEALGQAAIADTNTLNNLFNLNGVSSACSTPPSDACAQAFISAFATRAFRGQIDATETKGLNDVYAAVRAQFDVVTGIQAAITAVLESPRFLYVLEFGNGSPTGSVVPLSSYETAGRLALFLWRSVPDAALMTAAANNQLATPDQLQAQAALMLKDPKATSALDDFTTQWMELQSTGSLGKDSQFQEWNALPKIGAELKDETLEDFSQLVLAGNGGLSDLLTSPSSYINGDLAKFYGLSLGSGTAVTVNDSALDSSMSSFVKTNVNPNPSQPVREGILMSAGVLATQAHSSLPSSVLRGKLVREQVLCDSIPPPPPNVPPPAASVSAGATTRSVLEVHAKNACAVGCHQYMDPIGLGFGSFDATGWYQPSDANGRINPDGGAPQASTFPAVDASGQVLAMSPGEFSTTFTDAVDLVTQLAKSPQVPQCFTLQELRYALGRVETINDACSAQLVNKAFASKNLNIQQLMVAIVGSDAFRYRSVVTAGSKCQ